MGSTPPENIHASLVDALDQLERAVRGLDFKAATEAHDLIDELLDRLLAVLP